MYRPIHAANGCMSGIAGADPGFLKGGGVQIRSIQAKEGGADGGPILGPMLKSLHRGTKGGGGPDPPLGSATGSQDDLRGLTHDHKPHIGLHTPHITSHTAHRPTHSTHYNNILQHTHYSTHRPTTAPTHTTHHTHHILQHTHYTAHRPTHSTFYTTSEDPRLRDWAII